MKPRFINPYTDFGFKKLFGEEGSKILLKDFLNQILPPIHTIKELSFKKTEALPDLQSERSAVFDIYCESESGSKFIVEMQKAKINFFKDRMVLYSSFPIKEQAEKGEWDYKLQPVYCIAILDFVFEKGIQTNEFLTNVQLKDQYCNVFYDKLTFLMIEMPLFQKTESELKTHFDKWLYFLKNLENFNDIPSILKEEVFLEGFRKAEMANFNTSERDAYEMSLKRYRDLKGVIDTSFQEGLEKGEQIGQRKKEDQAIRNAVLKGKLSPEEIAEMLDISLDRVLQIKEGI
ncbi:MAG: Rpn family recombination-promoting nuclease/putative transposase [Spirochaetia bacterium]|nr:Rpn family recombination-promoting nuclease/putative transposase [Spirochaetia bacterium]